MHNLSGLEISIIIKELKEITGSYIEKFYEIDKNIFRLKLSSQKIQINIESLIPGRINITSFIKKSETPTNFAIAARKQITNYIINNIYQLNNDRIIVFNLKNKDTEKNIIFEMFGKGNLIITDKSMNIILCYNIHDFKDRQIRPGKTYISPKNDFIGTDLDKLKFILSDFKKSLEQDRKSEEKVDDRLISILSKYLNFGPLYIEDALLSINLDPKIRISKINDYDIEKIIQALKQELEYSSRIEPIIYLNDSNQVLDYSLFKLKKYEESKQKTFNSFNMCLDFLNEFPELNLTKPSQQKEEQLKQIIGLENSIKKQHQLLKSNQDQMEINKLSGEIIFRNMNIINALIAELRNNNKISIEELQKIFPDLKILNIDLKQKTILIDLD